VTDFAALRERMVSRQIEARGIDDPAVLAAMRAVPREQFVAPDWAGAAYDDRALPIEADQTISQPYIVALMVAAAALGPRDHVLEVGGGSGYAAAVLGQIAGSVIAIERHEALARLAAERLARLGPATVRIVAGDGMLGWPEGAPYDAILVAAGAAVVPPALVEQLRTGGRLVMPVGGRWAGQTLVRMTKEEDGSLVSERLCEVRFVPLVGGS
jgi:protein-L-isoaspartate(D-aspartate) O-methyltransferase